MDTPKSETRPVPITQQVTVKKVPVLPTPEQMHDSAAVQRQALEDWRRQRDKLQGKPALPMRFDEKRLQFCGRALGEFRTANREGQQRQVFVFPRERIVPNVPKMAN